jgi:phosphatidate cytidylyltransferase
MAGGRRDLARRVGVAAVAIPAVALLAWAGGLVFAALVALLAALAAWELYTMAARKGIVTLTVAGAVWAAAFPLLAGLSDAPGPVFTIAVPLAFVLFAPGALRLRPESGPLTALATSVFGAAYPGACLAFGVLLREMGRDAGEGLALLFFPLVVTWIGDTAAFFVGKAVGRVPLAPRISPHKTWEGAVAGFAGCILAGVAYAPVARAAGVPLGGTLAGALAALVAVAGQVGDLMESLLKRDCGVKDSSSLLPGHGGVLDRLDSLLFALPVTYLVLRLVWG